VLISHPPSERAQRLAAGRLGSLPLIVRIEQSGQPSRRPDGCETDRPDGRAGTSAFMAKRSRGSAAARECAPSKPITPWIAVALLRPRETSGVPGIR
jgi:hypothetical protein